MVLIKSDRRMKESVSFDTRQGQGRDVASSTPKNHEHLTDEWVKQKVSRLEV